MVKKKKMALSLPKFQDNKGSKHTSRDDITRNIALGATGVAITAGVVAAGAALANPKLRGGLSKVAEKGMSSIQNMSEEMPKKAEKYIATAHEIKPKLGLGKAKSAKKRGKKLAT